MKTRKYHPEEWIPVVGAFFRVARFNEICQEGLEEILKKDIPCFERSRRHQVLANEKYKELFTDPFLYYHAFSLASIIPYFAIRYMN